MMSDQERADYLIHLQRVTGELATLLDVYHLGEDRPAIQRAFDDVWAISKRLYAEQDEIAPEPVYQRLQTLERKANERSYQMHIEDGLIDLIPSGWPQQGAVHSFRINDAGIEAALQWLKRTPHAQTSLMRPGSEATSC